LKKKKKKYDYELVIIGGGSGGLACAKRANRFLNPEKKKRIKKNSCYRFCFSFSLWNCLGLRRHLR